MKLIRKGKDIILHPENHKRTIIWLHGLGDSAEGSRELFDYYPILKDCRYVLLTAPYRPVSLFQNEKAFSWFDIKHIEKREMNEQVLESGERVKEVITQETETCQKVFLGGFSQGGALALFTGLSHLDTPISGIIGISCYAMKYSIKDKLKKTPIFLFHGKDDEVVTYEMAKKSYSENFSGIKYEFLDEEGVGHHLSLNCVKEVREWLDRLC